MQWPITRGRIKWRAPKKFIAPSSELRTLLKAAKYEIQKPSTCRATLFRCKFLSIFRGFHLAWSTWPATKTFVAGWRNAARWLVDLLGCEQICCATSCEFDEKRATKPKFVAQSRPGLYFSQQLSSTRNKYFCCATSWSRNYAKHRRKLATKQCCVTSWRFLYLVFRRLYSHDQQQREPQNWKWSGCTSQNNNNNNNDNSSLSLTDCYVIHLKLYRAKHVCSFLFKNLQVFCCFLHKSSQTVYECSAAVFIYANVTSFYPFCLW